MVTTYTSHGVLIGRLKRLANPEVHVRGRDSGLSLGISACQQRCRACVPAHRQAAVGQASCAGAVGKLQGQGLCGWPLCATRGSRVGLASCLAASAALAATSSCCAVAFSALCAAAAACSAAAAKSAAGRTRHAVLRWRLRRGPSTCRHLSLTPGTITLSRRAVLRVDQLEQFLRALGKRRSVCSLSEVSDGALVRTKGAHTRLASSSIDDDLLDALKAANASAWRSGSAPP